MNHQDVLPLAEISEIDEAKRQWLQGMRHPVDTVIEDITEPEPAEILAEFIRQHSAAGQLVARAVFLSNPIWLQKRNCQLCWKALSRTETTRISLV